MDVEGNDGHAEAPGDLDRPSSDPTCPDHAECLVTQLEATQAGLREVAVPSPLDRPDQVTCHREQQGECVLRDRRVAVVRLVADRDPAAAAVGKIDMVISRLAGGAELQQNGRASCRDSVCPYVYLSLVAVSLKKKRN